MELFYAQRVQGGTAFLDPEESGHCIRVLRHKAGDEVNVVDGLGTMLKCRITVDSPKAAEAVVEESIEAWGKRAYSLTMAVCPTKNNERFEWFVEKATEIGVDVVAPVIGERSERKVLKPERARRVALSAMKQSLKAKMPEVREPTSVKEFILSLRHKEGLKLICYCFEDEVQRSSVTQVLRSAPEEREITILIGPEGDFSPEEAALARSCGFIPVHLGPSRLRTETAAVAAVAACYFERCLESSASGLD